MGSYNVGTAGIASKPITVAELADRERRDRGTELRAAGPDGRLARGELDGAGKGSGCEHAEEGGDGCELHFRCWKGCSCLVALGDSCVYVVS